MPEDAGALLVRSGLIANEQLRIAREAQASRGGSVGEHLVLAGFIDDEALADFYRTRLMVPQVRPEQLASISESLIAKIPADMATEFRCIPVACDRDRNLTLAMADPSTTHTVDEISFFTGHYVVRAVATQSQIAWSLAHYYGCMTPLGERLMTSSGRVALPGQGVSLPLPAEPADAHTAPALDREPAPHDEDEDEGGALPDADGAVPMVIESDRPSPQPHLAYQHIPPDSDQPYVSFLREDTAPTGPIRTMRRPITQPPELAARAGEVDIATGPVYLVDDSLPAVMISQTMEIATEPHGLERSRRAPTTEEMPPQRAPTTEEMLPQRAPITVPPEASGPAWTEEWEDTPAPGLVDTEAEAEAPEPEPEPEPDEDAEARADGVVLLDRPKDDQRRRRHKQTRIGLGFGGSRFDRSSRASILGEILDEPAAPAADDQPTEAPDHSVVPVEAPDQPTTQMKAPVPMPASWSALDRDPPDSIQTAARAAAEEYGRTHGATSGPAVPAASPQEEAVPDIIFDESTSNRGTAGRRRHAAHGPPVASRYDDDLTDEHWGPPGSTIPPELLGPTSADELDSGPEPIPLIADHLGGDFDEEDVARILGVDFDASSGQVSSYRPRPTGPSHPAAGPGHEPLAAAQERAGDAAASGPMPAERSGSTSDDIQIVESEPLRGQVAAGAVEERATGSRSGPAAGPSLSFHSSDPMDAGVMRELEESSLRLVEILRDLDQADSRNEVIDTLIEHLAESHERVAFFVVKSGELTTWKQRIGDQPIEKLDGVKLSLDEPSTFQDIVGTRLPFRGPLTDAVSRAFIAAALDHAAGEMLGLPVSVRGRVVAVLYGDMCINRVFEQHLAVVTRAAGVALERILRAKKGS